MKTLIGFASIPLIRSQRADAVSSFKLPECSDSITVLKSPSGKDVVLIGTAHISEDSVTLVRNVIRTVKPDVVMIELDRKRLGRVGDGESLTELGFEIPVQSVSLKKTEARTAQESNAFLSAFSGFQSQIGGWIRQSSGAVLGKALGSFYNNVEACI